MEKDGAAKQRQNSAAPALSATENLPRKESEPRRIVGIGASAGGLSAVGELLANLPVDTGMSFVLVQHLDPDHKSELATLLKKRSQVPVEEVAGNLTMKPNRVYVVPAGRSLSFADGVLELKARAKAPAVYHTIDSFFESLAADRGGLAIGVVLSGSGHDGTLGLEAIKAAGGITFAQDGTAKYATMPRSATAAGCVDFVLSPAAIALELGRLGDRTAGETSDGSERRRAGALKSAPQTKAAYEQIRQLLHRHVGVDFSGYKNTTFERRVNRRILLGKVDGPAGYARLLEGNSEELRRLFSDVLIHVTSFFRNPESFDFLKRTVIARLMAAGGTETARMWSLGCSTGQEAYSLAMACVEAADDVPGAPAFQIFASDLNAATVEQARTGFYTKGAVENLSPERLRRFFNEEHGGYRVSKVLRDRVVFAHQNALRDPPFSRLDLITCRNMLIYLEPHVQEKILPIFHYALKPGGHLFLGSAESASASPELFEALDKKHRIFRRKAGASGQTTLSARTPGGAKEVVALRPARAAAEGRAIDALRESDRLTLNRFAPAGVLVDEAWHVLQFRGDTSPWLKAPAGKASFHVLKMARDGVAVALRAALLQARKEGGAARINRVRVGAHAERRFVDIEVLPLKNTRERCHLVFFIEPGVDRDSAQAARTNVRARRARTGAAGSAEMVEQIASLERELSEARDYLLSFQQQAESNNEDLQASNEEAMSANEELQSLNEELETSKEEVESANEELITVNEEMTSRNLDLAHLNGDLVNLQVSAHLAIVLIGRDRSIRRFTEQAGRQFNLIAADVGRSFNHVKHDLNVPDLDAIIGGVIDNVREYEGEVRSEAGHWFQLRVRPYVTLDQKIDGAVLVLVDIEDLKRSEQQAKAALDHAQSTLDTVRMPLVVVSGELRIVSANRSFQRLFAVVAGEIVGRSYADLGGGEWAGEKLRTLVKGLLSEDTSFHGFEIEHVFKHLGRRLLLLNGCRMENPTERSERILLGIEDVTQRRAEEIELSDNRERFARIFNQTAAGIAQTDPAGRFTLMNDRFCQIVGRTREELFGRPMQAITHPDDVTENEKAFGDLVAGAIPEFAIEKRYVRPDGSIVWVHSEVAAIRGLDQRVQSVAAVVTDISQRRQSEATLRYQALLLRTLSDTAAQLLTAESPRFYFDVIFGRLAQVLGAEFYFIHLLSEDGRKLALESSMGLDATQKIAMQELAFEMGQAVEPPATDREESPRIGDPGDVAMETAVGRALGVQAYACHPLRVGRRLLGMLSVASARRERFDAAELRFVHAMCDLVATSMERARLMRDVAQARDMAERANIAKDNFFAALSHELRTPLNPVLLLASDGADNQKLPLGVRQDFAAIEKNVRMEARLIDDLLDLTRITHGKMSLECEPVSVGPVLQAAIDIVRPEIDAKRLIVELKEVPRELVVLGDAVRLQQIFWNILRNAVKFTPAGGRVGIEIVLLSGNRVGIAFTDTGMGMTAEELARIFEAFSQGDHAGPDGSHRFGGIGMGLAISRMLTELHGGTMRAESAGRDAGSMFSVELPLAPPTEGSGRLLVDVREETLAVPVPAEPLQTQKRVLLVEDHESTRVALSRLLINRGYDVTAAASVAAARRAADAAPFDLLISDIGLPDGSGHELMTEMRDRFGMKGVALTGYGMEADIARTKHSGFATHLIKPITVQTLVVALAAVTA